MPSLVFDLMEPFRPVIDRLLINAIFSDVTAIDFSEENTELPILSKPGKRKLITLFNCALKSRLKYRNSVTTIQNHILTEVKNLSDRIKQYD
jgi:CRISPR-associated protein Cas1